MHNRSISAGLQRGRQNEIGSAPFGSFAGPSRFSLGLQNSVKSVKIGNQRDPVEQCQSTTCRGAVVRHTVMASLFEDFLHEKFQIVQILAPAQRCQIPNRHAN